MSKKSKAPPWIQNYPQTGKGVSTDFADYAFWLTPEEEDHLGWFRALEQVDRKGDLTALLARLETVVPAAVWPHMEDLFNRYQLKRVPGKPRSPSYEQGAGLLRDDLLQRIRERVRTLKATGMTVRDAIERVALEFDIPESTLEAIYKDKHGGERRRMKQKKPRQVGGAK